MLPQLASLRQELQDEIPATRRVLERVPADRLTWKPHAKSRSLGDLAMHVAGILGMADRIANYDEFSFSAPPTHAPESPAQILAAFDKNAAAADTLLAQMSDETAQGEWRLVFQGREILSKPRLAVLRVNLLNHLYHHRGQLSVYLRLLDVPVPSIYGPTADENPFA